MTISKRRAGFTLVELLVAISILAIVAVLGWRGLDGIVRGRIVLTEQMETTRGMQLAFAQMQSDCAHLAGGDVLGRRPYLQWDADRLTLVRKVYVENEPSRLQVVSYRVAGGQLLRRESPGTRDLAQLEQLWQSISSDAPAQNSPPVALQNGVLGMQIQAWQNNAWRNEPAQVVGNPQQQQQPPLVQAPTGASNEPTGVQVALNVRNLAAPMIKSFLLGGT
ncbi:type II secretion system protein J [Massilia sp. AB1]|uniref:PulJ/GspJ family protein n=1 Tax=Massilia sp. AB1 TaxID=2823371 RepID=UPI001B82DA5C|nr:prepilin-type N-terminal cleavage/methylation domain-containing protein [Massilia sp. AB1]MBQ5940951.1 prepilin-type N-terminal cleavage/methylation domain-containing protein [Massilia sp. AB1]